MEQVVLVNDHDEVTGVMEKMEAHRTGSLHRAFSVLLFNSHGEMLLQKRAQTKYHSSGLWTNTCCSHPRPGEALEEAARRKLRQEMGIEANPRFAFKFQYKAPLDNQLIEHEIDHVFIGQFDGEPVLNEHEAEDWKFVDLHSLKQQVHTDPQQFTPWFRLILDHPHFRAPR
ncbi:MAG: isopentenyl-diphosphate Delta-isomerase [Cyclobacteriaceae bacterium]|jgi:isopentenyl-diphosphate delta-isomerase|nr:isopentenyl-diphosphate Delta-isomerase [Flammeovirgaceae bacterium]